MIRAACLAYALTVAAPAALVDHSRLLDALRQKEGWHGEDGQAGERGPWQLRLSVWTMHMPGIDWAKARQEGPACVCAVKHVAWLERQLIARGANPSVFNIALAWNAGLFATTHGRAPVRAYRFAGDVERIYQRP